MLNVPLNSNWLSEQAKSNGNLIAVKSDESEITYSQLYDLVLERTSSMETLQQTNVIAIPATHSLQFIVDLFACWNLGCAALPINPNLNKDKVAEQIKFTNSETINTGSSANGEKKLKIANSFSPDQSALIMFTSGSTGKEKAVVHTFRSLYSSTEIIDDKINFGIGETWLASLPFYRIGGFQIIIRSLLSGGMLLLPSQIKIDEIRNSILKFSPEYVSLVNASLQSLTENEKLKSAKVVFTGGGPIDNKLLERCKNLQLPIYKVYGSTETGSMVSMLNIIEESNKINSAGKPLDGVQIKIDDGEILLKSKSLFKEYFNDKNLTSEKMTNGWFRTGDCGFIDDDGYLFVKGRLDNFIISGGEKINPIEIEQIMLQIDKIVEAKVFGIKDDKWGEKVCAVFTADEKLNEEDILNFFKEKLPSYKVPKKVIQINKIPQNEMGKIDLNSLQNLFR